LALLKLLSQKKLLWIFFNITLVSWFAASYLRPWWNDHNLPIWTDLHLSSLWVQMKSAKRSQD